MTDLGMPVVAVVNPIAGCGDSMTRWAPVEDQLIASGRSVEVVATTSSSHATEAATAASATGACVVAVGGDGLVRDVAAGVVAGERGTLAIMPTGRGNDLAALLSLPTSSGDMVAMLQHGHTQKIDVLDVNGHIVPGNVYVGVDSLAARHINAHRRVPSLALYRGAGLVAAAQWRKTMFTLRYLPAGDSASAQPVTRTVMAQDIVVANSGRYGHGLTIVPSATLDDGVMDVLIVRHGSPLRVLSIMLAARRGTHVDRADVEVLPVTHLELSADRVVPFGADGDEVTTLPATIAVRPRALRIMVPDGPAAPST